MTFLSPAGVRVCVSGRAGRLVTSIERNGPARMAWRRCRLEVAAAARQILEFGVPFSALGVAPGHALACFLSLHLDGMELERYPGHRPLDIAVPSAEFEAYNWTA